MIINEVNKWVVVVAPGVVRNNRIHKTLAKIPGSIWAVSVGVDEWVNNHSTTLAKPWKEYRRVMVVRNPYTRFIELFHHYNMWQRIDKGLKAWRFEEFLGERKRLDWFYSQTINQWSANISPAEIVRVENLRDDLVARLGKIPAVARKEFLPRDRAPWRPYYSKVNYEFLVDLYHDVLPDLMYGYIDDAIPPKQARIYGRVDF